MNPDIHALLREMEQLDYVADEAIATAAYLAREMRKPLLVEGEAGGGKTELAKVMAKLAGTELIRLQCYEGLDVNTALYEWNYARQMLRARLAEHDGRSAPEIEALIFSREYLLERPLLRAITRRDGPAVLLIDEIDRADEEFEGYLLELLAEFQVTIPELGTVRAKEPPLVILTSNRTREVHDALKRRCLYQWIEYPTFDKELAIVRARVPAASARLAEQITTLVQSLRRQELYKVPGVSETIDWVTALVALDRQAIDPDAVSQTLGIVLKTKEDLESMRGDKLAGLVSLAVAQA